MMRITKLVLRNIVMVSATIKVHNFPLTCNSEFRIFRIKILLLNSSFYSLLKRYFIYHFIFYFRFFQPASAVFVFAKLCVFFANFLTMGSVKPIESDACLRCDTFLNHSRVPIRALLKKLGDSQRFLRTKLLFEKPQKTYILGCNEHSSWLDF